MLVFFSTSCVYCLRHNPRLQTLADAGVGLPLQVLGVAHEQHADEVRRHLARHGLRFAVTLDERPLHQALSPRRITPLTVVLDRTGRLQVVIPGEMSEDDVMGLLRWART